MPCASAFCVVRTMKSRLTLASAGPSGCFHEFIWPPAPCSMMPNVMLRVLMTLSTRCSMKESRVCPLCDLRRFPRAGQQFDRPEPFAIAQHGRIDDEFLNAVAFAQCVELPVHVVRRAFDNMRPMLVDAVT